MSTHDGVVLGDATQLVPAGLLFGVDNGDCTVDFQCIDIRAVECRVDDVFRTVLFGGSDRDVLLVSLSKSLQLLYLSAFFCASKKTPSMPS